MANADKELAQLAAEEKKLLEQQKNERDALKKKTHCGQETVPRGTVKTE